MHCHNIRRNGLGEKSNTNLIKSFYDAEIIVYKKTRYRCKVREISRTALLINLFKLKLFWKIGLKMRNGWQQLAN